MSLLCALPSDFYQFMCYAGNNHWNHAVPLRPPPHWLTSTPIWNPVGWKLLEWSCLTSSGCISSENSVAQNGTRLLMAGDTNLSLTWKQETGKRKDNWLTDSLTCTVGHWQGCRHLLYFQTGTEMKSGAGMEAGMESWVTITFAPQLITPYDALLWDNWAALRLGEVFPTKGGLWEGRGYLRKEGFILNGKLQIHEL